jgi:hypothetical protein
MKLPNIQYRTPNNQLSGKTPPGSAGRQAGIGLLFPRKRKSDLDKILNIQLMGGS